MTFLAYYVIGAILYMAFATGMASWIIDEDIPTKSFPLFSSSWGFVFGVLLWPLNVFWYIFMGFASMIERMMEKKREDKVDRPTAFAIATPHPAKIHIGQEGFKKILLPKLLNDLDYYGDDPEHLYDVLRNLIVGMMEVMENPESQEEEKND